MKYLLILKGSAGRRGRSSCPRLELQPFQINNYNSHTLFYEKLLLWKGSAGRRGRVSKALFFEIFLPLEEEWRQKRKSVIG
jgi:hypothetical protein